MQNRKITTFTTMCECLVNCNLRWNEMVNPALKVKKQNKWSARGCCSLNIWLASLQSKQWSDAFLITQTNILTCAWWARQVQLSLDCWKANIPTQRKHSKTKWVALSRKHRLLCCDFHACEGDSADYPGNFMCGTVASHARGHAVQQRAFIKQPLE